MGRSLSREANPARLQQDRGMTGTLFPSNSFPLHAHLVLHNVPVMTHETGRPQAMHQRSHDDARQEHAAIEWHDSTISAITCLPDALVIDLRAIVHRSHGEPGTDPGSVWVQAAAVILAHGQQTGSTPFLPDTIHDGQVWSTYDYDHLIRCPFLSNGQASLDLILSSGDLLQFDADQLSITFTGDPKFLEAFVPEKIEDDDGV
jgi:hypothetical protein